MRKSFKSLGVGIFGGALAVLAAACSEEVAKPTSSTSVAPAEPAASSGAPAASTPATIGSGETKTIAIDNAVGGSVALADGTKIEVPPGALPEGVTLISVTSSTEAAPSSYTTYTPSFTFAPDGAVFEKPLTVSFPVTLPSGVGTGDVTVLWSRPAGQPGYDMVPTTFNPGSAEGSYVAVAQVTHFSEGFVGRKYTVDPLPPPDPYAH